MVPLAVESGIIFFLLWPVMSEYDYRCYFSKIKGWYVTIAVTFRLPTPIKKNTQNEGLHWDVPRAHGWCTVAIGGLKCWYRRAKPSVDWDCNKGKAWPETFTTKWQVADLSHTFSQTNKPQMVANDLNIGETRDKSPIPKNDRFCYCWMTSYLGMLWNDRWI